MASRASLRRPAPYNYETPEQRAREQLRAQKVIAGVTTRANEQAQSVAALAALAKATGVPLSQLPAGGIHPGMSPADVQAATDRINGWVARQPGGQAGQVARTAQTNGQAPISPAATAIAGALGLPTPPAAANATPAPQTRTTPTGGTETLVPSESGPRWVASVNNAPAPNNQNGQISRDPGGQTRQVQMNPIALRGAGAPATVAQNQAFYANPTSPAGSLPPPTPKPWQPAAGDYAYATGLRPTVTASPVAPKETIPGLAATLEKPAINPATGNGIPGLPANAGAVPEFNSDAADASRLKVATTPVGGPWTPQVAPQPVAPVANAAGAAGAAASDPAPGFMDRTGEYLDRTVYPHLPDWYKKIFPLEPGVSESGHTTASPPVATTAASATKQPTWKSTPSGPSAPQQEQDQRQFVARTPQAEQDMKRQVPPQAPIVSAPQMEQNLKQQVPQQPDEEEEQRKRMAATRAIPPTPQPYQF